MNVLVVSAVAAFSLLQIEAAESPAKPGVFDLPFIQLQYSALQGEIQALFRQQKYAEGEERCRQAMKLVPHDPIAPYNLACALARQSKKDEALEALELAVALGFNQSAAMAADEDLALLRDEKRFIAAVKSAVTAKPDAGKAWTYSPQPAEIEEGVALVSEKNSVWDGRAGLLRAIFKFGPKPSAEPVVGFGEAGDLVRKWYAEGTAAGNHGDLYDNHATDHANMNYAAFPHLARIEFADEVKKRNLHHGLQTAFAYNGPTLGNSSTALVHGVFWRCQVRNALTQPNGPQRLAQQYFSNHLYVYPEHRDYDPGRNGNNGKGYGDVLPANTPYTLLSQGSSGSDQPFLDAVALTMAAFQPAVKAKLVQTGTLMPAVQMIFRRSNKMVVKPDDYFTGRAHPPVFDGGQIDLVRMVTTAHELTEETLPPIVQIVVKDEDRPTVGLDYFDTAEREKLFDTPCAIARVIKGTQHSRRFVLSAEDSRNITNSLTRKFQWVVLRGDAEKIRIETKNDSGSIAEINIPYHMRRPIAEGSDMESGRVDIGVFVSNEHYPSAPAFLSLQYLDNQKRVYDDQGRIVSVDYADPEVSKNYIDPLLDLTKNWRDEYRYDDRGRLLGWTRIRGDVRERFTFDGCLVTEADAKDRPLVAKIVRYVAKQQPDQAGSLEQVVSEESVRYEYDGDDDLRGRRAGG